MSGRVVVSLNSRIPFLIDQIRAGASQIVGRTAHAVRTAAVLAIQNPPKTGGIYTKRGKQHQASAPGEAPATDTGYLANSIQVDYEPGNLSAAVTVSAEYGEVLELGGRNIAPRPYLMPALEKEKDDFEAAIRDLIR